jgi:hemolysin III
MIHTSLSEANEWFNGRLQDGGPIYMETNPEQFIVEPWNAFSSLLMLVPAFIWFWKIRKELSHYRFLLFAILMVALGGLGSGLFHGFRVSVVFLLMDIIPSALLTLSLSVYLWLKILRRWWYVLLILLPTFGIRFLFWNKVPDHLAINISYFITGLIVALPLLIILIRDRFHEWTVVILGVTSFMLALLFRQLDTVEISLLPMGTHFLWHLFSAVGAWFILKYIHYLRNIHFKPASNAATV